MLSAGGGGDRRDGGPAAGGLALPERDDDDFLLFMAGLKNWVSTLDSSLKKMLHGSVLVGVGFGCFSTSLSAEWCDSSSSTDPRKRLSSVSSKKLGSST
jgi:hypothetical protein